MKANVRAKKIGKVLIVDDCTRTRTAIRATAADLVEEAFEAGDGEAAIRAYLLHQPDWVAMDLIMSTWRSWVSVTRGHFNFRRQALIPTRSKAPASNGRPSHSSMDSCSGGGPVLENPPEVQPIATRSTAWSQPRLALPGTRSRRQIIGFEPIKTTLANGGLQNVTTTKSEATPYATPRSSTC